MHELQAMNIQMRIITEDNIEQLTNMGYSNNIIKMKNSEQSLEITLAQEKRNRQEQGHKGLGENIDTPIDQLNEPIESPVEQSYVEPEIYGWSFYSYDEERGEAYNSIILDKNGKPSEI